MNATIVRERIEKGCPRCHAPLRSMRCAACAVTYPTPAGIPVMVAEPSRHLAECYVDTLHHLKNGQARVAAFEGLRSAEHRRAAEALNLELLQSTLQALEPHVEARRVADVAIEKRATVASAYGDAIRYALRDWSHTETAELELRGIDARVRALLPPKPVGRGVVLGAGTGRTCWNLRDRFAELIAIDLSFSMAHAFSRVREGGVTLADTEVCTAGDSFASYPLSAQPTEGEAGGAFEYWVANATALPFADASVDVVCCFYFLDVVRLTTLLAEVRRVLRPGGRFVNLGPLFYHHDDVTEHLEPQAIRQLLRTFDLQIDGASEQWQTITHLRINPSSSQPKVHATWSFRADLMSRHVSHATVLRPRWPTRSQVTGEGDATLFFSNRKAEVSTLEAEAVALLEGSRTVQTCLEALSERYEIGPADESTIIAALERLRGLGVLEWVE